MLFSTSLMLFSKRQHKRLPMTPTENRVAKIYAELLQLDRVEASDDLYELGCDSQQAVRIALQIERTFSVSLPLEIMETTGRVSDVAAWVDEQFVRETSASDGGLG